MVTRAGLFERDCGRIDLRGEPGESFFEGGGRRVVASEQPPRRHDEGHSIAKAFRGYYVTLLLLESRTLEGPPLVVRKPSLKMKSDLHYGKLSEPRVPSFRGLGICTDHNKLIEASCDLLFTKVPHVE